MSWYKYQPGVFHRPLVKLYFTACIKHSLDLSANLLFFHKSLSQSHLITYKSLPFQFLTLKIKLSRRFLQQKASCLFCRDQRPTLGSSSKAVLSFLGVGVGFEAYSFVGLELTKLAKLDSLESTGVTFLLKELHVFPGFPAGDHNQAPTSL